jgi:hypothetical protein
MPKMVAGMRNASYQGISAGRNKYSMRSFEVRNGHFDLDPERLTSAIPPQTKMIYIVNPHHPRGHRPHEKHRFVKVSTSVSKRWIEEFVELPPAMMERARGLNASCFFEN